MKDLQAQEHLIEIIVHLHVEEEEVNANVIIKFPVTLSGNFLLLLKLLQYVRPFCDKLSVHFGVSLRPFSCSLRPFSCFLRPLQICEHFDWLK